MKTRIIRTIYGLAILAVVISLGVCPVKAGNVDFYSDAIIRPGEVYDIVSVYDTPPVPTIVHMFGGKIRTLKTYDSSSANIHDGQISESINIYNLSTVNIHGGNIDLIYFAVSDLGTLNIYGGELCVDNAPYFSESSTVNIYGYDFSYDGVRHLTGFLADGSSFIFSELSPSRYSHMNLIVIPEPITILLFSLGSSLIRKRR